MTKNITTLFTTCALTTFFMALNVRGQGTIAINNLNGSGTSTSTSLGLFWSDFGSLSVTPINVTILGGSDPNSLTPIVTLAGANALTAVAPGGRYTDSSGGIYAIPGVAAGQPATLQILAWYGNAPTFAQADPAQDVFYPFPGASFFPPTLFTFRNPTGGAMPESLDGMPAMVRILDVPEPSTMALFALCALLLGQRLLKIS